MKLLALDSFDYCLLKVACVSAFVGADVTVVRAGVDEMGEANEPSHHHRATR